MFLRDLIDTTNVYLKMMEKYCQGSIVVQSRTKKKKSSKKPKQVSKKEPKAVNKKLTREEIMVRLFRIDSEGSSELTFALKRLKIKFNKF